MALGSRLLLLFSGIVTVVHNTKSPFATANLIARDRAKIGQALEKKWRDRIV